jgi:hypothetical protein
MKMTSLTIAILLATQAAYSQNMIATQGSLKKQGSLQRMASKPNQALTQNGNSSNTSPRYYYQPDTSADNRQGKTFAVTAQLLGSTVAPTAGYGLSLAYHFTGNDLMQIEATSGIYNYNESSVFLEPLRFKLSATTIGTNYKRFFGNSFYGKFGADYRKLTLSDVSVGKVKYLPSELGNAESIAASVAIGNQWQFDYFTIGCDWFGIMAPISTIGTKSNVTGISNANDRAEIEDSWNKIATVTTYQVLRFYMGATF